MVDSVTITEPDKTLWRATSSSFASADVAPSYAVDGIFSTADTTQVFQSSQEDAFPWIQVGAVFCTFAFFKANISMDIVQTKQCFQ